MELHLGSTRGCLCGEGGEACVTLHDGVQADVAEHTGGGGDGNACQGGAGHDWGHALGLGGAQRQGTGPGSHGGLGGSLHVGGGGQLLLLLLGDGGGSSLLGLVVVMLVLQLAFRNFAHGFVSIEEEF